LQRICIEYYTFIKKIKMRLYIWLSKYKVMLFHIKESPLMCKLLKVKMQLLPQFSLVLVWPLSNSYRTVFRNVTNTLSYLYLVPVTAYIIQTYFPNMFVHPLSVIFFFINDKNLSNVRVKWNYLYEVFVTVWLFINSFVKEKKR